MRVFCWCFVFRKYCCKTLSEWVFFFETSQLLAAALFHQSLRPGSRLSLNLFPVLPLSERLTLIALPLQPRSRSAASSPSIGGCAPGPFVLVRGAHFQACETINLSDSAEISNIELDVCAARRYISTCQRVGCSESKASALNCRNVSDTVSLLRATLSNPVGIVSICGTRPR